ncbi:proline-rich 4-like protein [Labeo rohita]|uniref:Proline-rich 4-like protein n=1 Tax=Labeo rohita TaxID=84645 RepID=A0A498NZR4_LABRO|nr:proline-rich 4-like protein [Labeo rohita]
MMCRCEKHCLLRSLLSPTACISQHGEFTFKFKNLNLTLPTKPQNTNNAKCKVPKPAPKNAPERAVTVWAPALESVPVWAPAPESVPVWAPAPESVPAWAPAPESVPVWAPAPESVPVWAPAPESVPVVAPAPESVPVSALAPEPTPVSAQAPVPSLMLASAPEELSKSMSKLDPATLKDTPESVCQPVPKTLPVRSSDSATVTKPSWRSRPVRPVPAPMGTPSQVPFPPFPPSVSPNFGLPRPVPPWSAMNCLPGLVPSCATFSSP